MRGLILATALVPTIGHQFLVNFGNSVLTGINPNSNLYVLISERSSEPTRGIDRIAAFQEQFAHLPNIRFVLHSDDNAPQSDDGTPEFWNYWKNIIRQLTGQDQFDFVFGSEMYCLKLAEQVGATFIPCDIERSTIGISGTQVRNDILSRWDMIMPAFQKYIQTHVCVFGAESCAKTTMTRNLHKHYSPDCDYTEEWARPYLEKFGPEVTDEHMNNITIGQYALQNGLRNTSNIPLFFHDTDLLSTIGYYRIFGSQNKKYDIERLWRETKSDLYIVMNSNIPFEEDILRYGDGVRESTDQFWIDILEEFNCNYHYVKSTDRDEQLTEVSKVVNDFMIQKYSNIRDFVRD